MNIFVKKLLNAVLPDPKPNNHTDDGSLLTCFNDEAETLFNDDPLVERTYEGLNAIDDGAPYGESYGTWSDSD
ncbi:hypothetical protein DBV23_06335 [Edwardsiella ictaluri]|uniref:Uncharacterized protein n=1 Tax=Edwardsiella ictaluri (strain 93-146) TaxID=634503 RepID=C5BDI3_EDWI9|nr:hypothetical protein [Edwardsiella ictaluri]ACR67599.1 hypothetical protein NT01EI_0357 [Edwardsiella ictaluri 93-146]AVZ81924.1 hypothetical protein DBV23_06335 [Edwardsiella ictaluri]EKS7762265.1 hypothetical protein [Edwardsiella ictaluri]EKS7769092.1 hypothetical protein [Edwardsiella ictaluri]EKS7772241.1 hypothetical protein [Edwardsiella ictaluri]